MLTMAFKIKLYLLLLFCMFSSLNYFWLWFFFWVLFLVIFFFEKKRTYEIHFNLPNDPKSLYTSAFVNGNSVTHWFQRLSTLELYIVKLSMRSLIIWVSFFCSCTKFFFVKFRIVSLSLEFKYFTCISVCVHVHMYGYVYVQVLPTQMSVCASMSMYTLAHECFHILS